MRALYAADYLESGCTIEFDDIYAVDNTLWTYVSAYAIAGMALLSGFVIYFSDRREAILMTLYFIVTSVGYALAGCSHQTSITKNDWQYRILGPIALAVTVLGTAFLMRVGVLQFFFPDSIFANVTWFSSNVAVIFVSALLKLYIVAAIWVVVINVGMSIIYFQQATSSMKAGGRVWLVLKILAMLVTVTGYVIQYILGKTCGVDGLQNCFAGCPLADPTAFNNTAIKNVLVAVGVVFLAIAEIFLPAHEFWVTDGEEESVFSTEHNIISPRDQSKSSIGHEDENHSAAGSYSSSHYIEEY